MTKEQVSERLSLLESIINFSEDAIISKTLEGIITSWNKGAENIFGYTADEVIGKHISVLIPQYRLNEEDEIISKIKSGSYVAHYETERITKSGAIIYISLTVSPIKNEHGMVVGASKIARDITDRKKIEQEILKLNQSLEQKVLDRTAMLEVVNNELESFSYSVAHDLRAPLRIINGYADILKTEYNNKLDAEGDRIINVIMNNTQRMGTLIDEILNLARFGRKELTMQDTNMTTLLDIVIAEQIAIVKKPVKFNIDKLPNAFCDSALIRQVWSNLISNAIKYSGKEKDPQVEINSILKDNYIVYSVKDNGVGFDMQYSDKLFGVFQRLHKQSEFEGTGVGLALVQRIITKHGGYVWADAEVDKGATFYFSLPTTNRVN